jgi:hypothetical protein
MTQDEKPRSGYQERLATELRALAERNAAEAPPKPASRRGVARRPKLALTGIAGGACVASAAIAFTGGDGGGSTAYAVEPHDDGSVTVEISRLEDAAGLERQLRAVGVPAEVDFLPLGRTCREPRFKPAPRRALELFGGLSIPVTLGAVATGPTGFERRLVEQVSFRLQTGETGDLRAGETLVITSRQGLHPRAEPSQTMTSITLAIAQGDVAPCDPVQARAPTLESEEPGADGAPTEPAGGSGEPGRTGRRK